MSTGNARRRLRDGHSAPDAAAALEIPRRPRQDGPMPNHLVAGLLPGHPADRIFMTTPDGRRFTYGDVARLSARAAGGACRARRPAGRPRGGAGGEIAGGAFPLSRRASRRRRLPAAQHRLHALRGRVFRRRCAAEGLHRRPGEARGACSRASRRGVAHVETLAADGSGSFADLAAEQSGDFDDVARGPSDLAAILYTSGTTGRSKGAMLTHENLRSNAATLVETWRFTSDDVLIHALPIFHTHGLFVATNVILMAGASMILLPKFDPAEAIALFREGDGADGRADLLHAAARPARADARDGGEACASSSPAQRRSLPRRTGSSASAPATPSSSATA